MVKKYLPLAEMLQLERRARARDRSEYEIFVLDTNAFEYNYSEVPDNVVVTGGLLMSCLDILARLKMRVLNC